MAFFLFDSLSQWGPLHRKEWSSRGPSFLFSWWCLWVEDWPEPSLSPLCPFSFSRPPFPWAFLLALYLAESFFFKSISFSAPPFPTKYYVRIFYTRKDALRGQLRLALLESSELVYAYRIFRTGKDATTRSSIKWRARLRLLAQYINLW